MRICSTAMLVVALFALHSQAQDATPRKVVVPAGTVVQIEIAQAVTSEEQAQGDTFPIKLHAPLIVDGIEVLPAGTPGMGEVVHAEQASHRQAGELILAARYLDHAGQRVRLAALHVQLEDIDASSRAMTWMRAHYLADQTVFTDKGVAAGTVAEAKLAQGYVFELK